jgi:YD repeat-containing protein
MKKNLLTLMALSLFAFSFVSCDKDDDNKEETTLKVRIASFADDWDTWTYNYDAAGILTNVTREESKQWNFAYNADTINISGYETYKLVLGENGYVASMTDEWGDVRIYTYDAAGYMTQVKKNGSVVSNLTVTSGCITSWSKWTMKGTDTENTEHFKNQEFSIVKNVANIHNIYSEMCGASRWLVETGLFGRPSVYLSESTVWDYSTSAAALTYVFDSNNCVTQEIKTGADYVENFFYTWTVLE